MKKTLSLILMSIIMVACFVVPTYAAETEYDLSAAGDGSVTAVFNDETGVLTISGTGTMKDYTWSSSSNPLNSILASVTKLVVEDGVTNLGKHSLGLDYSTSLKNCTDVSLPTSLRDIGDYAFTGLGAEELIIPEGVTSIGEKAFYRCSAKKISIPSTVTSIGAYAFSECYSVENFIFNATECAFPTSILSNSGTDVSSNVIGKNASSKVATVPASEVWMIDALTAIGYTVTTTGSATEADKWSSYPTDCVFELGAETPNNVVGYVNTYAGTIDIKGSGDMKDYSSYTPFKDSTSTNLLRFIKSINIDDGITHIGAYTFYWYASGGDIYASDTVVLPDSLISIGKSAFERMSITKVTLPDTLQVIGDTAFSFTDLTSVEIPNSVTEIGKSAFSNTQSLKTVTFEDNSSLKVIKDNAFDGASITSIEIPNSVETIGSVAFRETDLTSVVIPDSVTSLGSSAFQNCPDLESVVISNNITAIGSYTFQKCTKLKNVTIGEKVESIGEYAFGSTGLESIVLPASVNKIENWAFYQSRKLESVTVLSPDSQTLTNRPFAGLASNPTIYQYSANTALTTEIVDEYDTDATIVYLDGGNLALSGDLDNGIHWEYDPATKTLSFTGTGDVPNFKDGQQPWYAAAVQHGGIDTYQFGDGVTSIGSGIFGSYGNSAYGGNGSGASAYGPAGLGYGGASYAGTMGGSGGGGGSTGGEGGGGGSTDDGNTGSGGSDSGNTGDSTDSETPPVNKDAMIILDAVPTNFMVTVPIAINVVMDADGSITTGNGYVVENACAWGPVIIKDIKVVAETNWTLVDYNSDFANMRASTKKLGMTINGVEVASSGAVSMNESLSSVIKYQESKDLTFDVKLPAQKIALQENIAAVVFTVDFDKV